MGQVYITDCSTFGPYERKVVIDWASNYLKECSVLYSQKYLPGKNFAKIAGNIWQIYFRTPQVWAKLNFRVIWI